MANVFIGWSGNSKLAYKVKAILETVNHTVTVGGGTPKDMFVGGQVISQINDCTHAILLVEDKDGQVSGNLFYEWGYISAKMNSNNVFAYLINSKARDLPSDLLGVWVNELTCSNRNDEEAENGLAARVCEHFLSNCAAIKENSYFDIIHDWPDYRSKLVNYKRYSDEIVSETILFGCFAAYYYGDNIGLRSELSHINGSEKLNRIVYFAKSYIDIFLNSGNMSSALPPESFFEASEVMEMMLERKYDPEDPFETCLNFVIYDAYGLACYLFMRNEDLDEGMLVSVREKAHSCFENVFKEIERFETQRPNEKCLSSLIRCYIYNDMSHLLYYFFKDNDGYHKYLDLAVDERKKLFVLYQSEYRNNSLLAAKLEQEYMIALSEQISVMPNDFKKRLALETVKAKYIKWKKEIAYSSSLTDRIGANLAKIGAKVD